MSMDLPHVPSDEPVAARQVQGASRKAALEERIRAEHRATLVVNTASRRGRRSYATAKHMLCKRGIVLDAAYPVRDPARLPKIVEEAIAQGARFVVVGGGDGTISAVVDHFAHRDVVLGLLPLGTANSFARTLGIPLSLDAAVDVLVDGRVVDTDLGKINDDYFANAAAIGLPASIARNMPGALKRSLGRVGYLLVAVVRLCRHRPFRCRIVHEHDALSIDSLEVRIANGRYQGGVLVARNASVESRDLVIQIVKGISRWTIVGFWARALVGIAPRADTLQIVRCAQATIDTEPAQYVSIDGEAATRTPIRASVAREALLLMAPRERSDLQ